MANKVTSFTDLIQRVTASCLLHPLAGSRQDISGNHRKEYKSDEEEEEEIRYEDALEGEEETIGAKRNSCTAKKVSLETVREMNTVMEETFAAAAALKRAYVALQNAHSPWDPEKMRIADVAVVAEFRRIGILRERFRRMRATGTSGGEKNGSGGLLREAVAPYEAVVEELKREVKVKDAERENLKEKIKLITSIGNGSKKNRSISSRKVSCSAQMAVSPVPEFFEMTMTQVKEASKRFTRLLLSLMRTAHWDIAAAVRYIAAADADATATVISSLPIEHAKYALESYINRKIFRGFDHETFYIDGSLSSLLNPDQYRRDCFAQFKDMNAMDPLELLGILPTCNFGKFCSNKYLSIVDPKMEESLFGDLDQQRLVLAGNHPRTSFYEEFSRLAKAVWLLHLLAFSLDPAPTHFEACRGAEFHPQYMDSVVRLSLSNGGPLPTAQSVGFAVSPGFKTGSHVQGSVVKARVYLVSNASST